MSWGYAAVGAVLDGDTRVPQRRLRRKGQAAQELPSSRVRPLRRSSQGDPATAATASVAGDPLAQHGYRTEGPIASGAFSTIVHAKRIGAAGRGPIDVAVKSFDNAKCLKNPTLCKLRDNETSSLRTVREPGANRRVHATRGSSARWGAVFPRDLFAAV